MRAWVEVAGEIEMNPAYQRRGGIWSPRERSFLIDSILNGYDVPKFYLADLALDSTIPLNPSRRRYAVIDGKQRFEAIFAFARDELALDEAFIWEHGPELPLAERRYTELRGKYPRVAHAFDNFLLDVMLVTTDDEFKINDLFVRLNSSKPLTGAEVRNAMVGAIPPRVRKLARHTFFTDRVRFRTDRGQDLNTAAKLLLIEFHGRLVDTKKKSLDRFAEMGQSVTDTEGLLGDVLVSSEAQVASLERAFAHAISILDLLALAFRTKDPLLGSQGPVVIYYWLVRENPSTDPELLRAFAQDFEHRRAQNRALARAGLPSSPHLSEYTDLNRSINDVGSLVGRYYILQREYDDFRASGPSGTLWVTGDR